MSTQLTSDRLEFRELSSATLGDFHELVCDEHIRRYLLDGQEMSRQWCEQILENTSAERLRGGPGIWLLQELNTPAPFGFAGYLRFEGDDSPLQLLYALRASHTGRGFAREAAVALVEFAREGCAMSEILAAVDEPNVASARVLDHLGFQVIARTSGNFGSMLQYRLPPDVSPTK